MCNYRGPGNFVDRGTGVFDDLYPKQRQSETGDPHLDKIKARFATKGFDLTWDASLAQRAAQIRDNDTNAKNGLRKDPTYWICDVGAGFQGAPALVADMAMSQHFCGKPTGYSKAGMVLEMKGNQLVRFVMVAGK